MVKYTLWGKTVDIQIPEDRIPKEADIEAMDKLLPGVEHGWFESNGSNLHYRKMVPEGKINAVVVFAHGIHADGGKVFIMKDGRKLSVALLRERLFEKGYALYTLDELGHGFSEGYRFFVPSYQTNRDDLVAFSKFVSTEHEGVPFFLMGESYGGGLAIHCGKVFQDEPPKAPSNFKGLLLIAPAVKGDTPPAHVVFILRYMFAPFFPRWVPFFMPNPVSADRIWRDPEAREANLDPKRLEFGLTNGGSPFQLGTAVSLLLCTLDVQSKVVPELTVPFCSVHGADDAAVLPEGTKFLDENAKTPKEDKAVLLLDECYHDVLGDPLGPQGLDFLLEFMERRLQ